MKLDFATFRLNSIFWYYLCSIITENLIVISIFWASNTWGSKIWILSISLLYTSILSYQYSQSIRVSIQSVRCAIEMKMLTEVMPGVLSLRILYLAPSWCQMAGIVALDYIHLILIAMSWDSWKSQFKRNYIYKCIFLSLRKSEESVVPFEILWYSKSLAQIWLWNNLNWGLASMYRLWVNTKLRESD